MNDQPEYCDYCSNEVSLIGDDALSYCDTCEHVVEGNTHGNCEWCDEPGVLWTGEGWLCEKHHKQLKVDLGMK